MNAGDPQTDEGVDGAGSASASTVRALRSPWAVVGVWAWQAVVSFVAAYPAASLVAAAYGKAPSGDAPLWAEGGHALLDLLVQDAHGVTAAARSAALVILIGAVVGLVPMAALMAAMVCRASGRGPLGLPRALRVAAEAFPTLGVLLVAMSLGQALCLGGGWAAMELVEAWAHADLGEARSQILGGAFAIPFLVGAVALGLLHDLSRAAAVRFRMRCLPALLLGARALRREPTALAFAWAWRGTASLAIVAIAAWVTPGLGGHGGAAVAAAAFCHQLAALARVGIRASWLATALTAIGALYRPYFSSDDRDL